MCDVIKKDCGGVDQLQHLQPIFLACCWPASRQLGPNRRLAALSGEAADDWSDVIRRTHALQTRGTIPFKLLALTQASCSLGRPPDVKMTECQDWGIVEFFQYVVL